MDVNSLDLLINGDINKTLTRKHIAERQRRARINAYLEEIQELTSAQPKSNNPVKLEKAEVLERAVSYLQQLHSESDNNNNSPAELSDTEIYKNGFTSCMNKLVNKVSNSREFKGETDGLTQHLDSFLHNLTTESESTEPNSENHELESNMAYCSNNYVQAVQPLNSFVSGHDTKRANNQPQHWSHDGSNGYNPSAPPTEQFRQPQNMYRHSQNSQSTISEWAHLQMQYVQQQQHYETQGHQNQTNYSALQEIQNVYENYLRSDSDKCSIRKHDGHTSNEQSHARAVDLSEYARENILDENATTDTESGINEETFSNISDEQSEETVKVWRPW